MASSSSLDLNDERKRKRKQSNRESARRSRMRKQKRLDDLTAQVGSLRKENGQIMDNIGVTTQCYVSLEAENSVLRAQLMELSQRLGSLNDIVGFVGGTDDENGEFEDYNYNFGYFNQPIMANADVFLY